MRAANKILAIALLACATCAAAQSQPAPNVLLGVTGLVQSLQLPVVSDPLVNAAGGKLLLQPPAAARIRQVQDTAGGVPGIDGLNFSPVAMRQAFRGLDPDLVEMLFADANTSLYKQINQDLNRVLPGLQDQTQTSDITLPGLDGLPVIVPKSSE